MTRWVVYPTLLFQDKGEVDHDDIHDEQDDGRSQLNISVLTIILTTILSIKTANILTTILATILTTFTNY